MGHGSCYDGSHGSWVYMVDPLSTLPLTTINNTAHCKELKAKSTYFLFGIQLFYSSEKSIQMADTQPWLYTKSATCFLLHDLSVSKLPSIKNTEILLLLTSSPNKNAFNKFYMPLAFEHSPSA
jgi:hypothetical protein